MTLKDVMATDRNTFLCSNEFAVSATHTGNNSITGETEIKTIVVDFNDDPETILNVETGGVSTSGPRATAKTDDIPNVKKGDMLKIKDTEYNIIEIKPDGDPEGKGFTELILSKD